ncbi:uncharacterized protein [Drosophila takahashii]|uniref:uncharacterized protein n=1 Tax=Drosophila takahashii TaxID=29030 RepID=UPI0038994D97
MTAKSNVLTIGTEAYEVLDKPAIQQSRKEMTDSVLEQHLQKILLNGRPNVYVDGSVETISAKEYRKNGQYIYELGPTNKINGYMHSCPTFEAKGALKRIKNKISKDHWISDNVVKFPKDSRNFIFDTVFSAVNEESSDIYFYLCYLNEHRNR